MQMHLPFADLFVSCDFLLREGERCDQGLSLEKNNAEELEKDQENRFGF